MAQIDTQKLLDLTEASGQIIFWDIEATGLNSDYNSVLAVSIKPYGQEPMIYSVKTPGNDRALVKEVNSQLARYTIWVTYYGKVFDARMIQGRLLAHRLPALLPQLHLDMYFALKYHVNPSRRSQAHLLEWLGLPEKKMTLSPEEWNAVLHNPKKGLKVMRARCRSDTIGLEALYRRTRHLIRDIKR